MVHRHFPVIAGTVYSTFVFLSPIRSDRHARHALADLESNPTVTLAPGSRVVNTVVTHLNTRSSALLSDIHEGTYPATHAPRSQLRS